MFNFLAKPVKKGKERRSGSPKWVSHIVNYGLEGNTILGCQQDLERAFS